MRTSILITAALLVPAIAARAQTGDVISEQGAHVLAHVHAVDELEITLAKLAQEHGTAAVHHYAAHMITDHGKADRDVQALAKKHDVSITAVVPADPAEVADAKIAEGTEYLLATLSGTDFDRAYLRAMDDGHRHELGKIDAAILTVRDPAVLALLREIRPVVQAHADEAHAELAKLPSDSHDAHDHDATDRDERPR